MSSFQCSVVRVTIEPHPNADAIELAIVGGYTAIVQKGRFVTDDLAIYIPEQSVMPDWLLKLMGFWDEVNNKGGLSGSAGNRVRAMKLRGVLSQGLLLPFIKDGKKLLLPMPGEHPELGVNFDQTEQTPVPGDDFAEYLGVTKYEPVIPLHLAGKTAGGDLDATIGYDFENIKKNPSLFEDGMEVSITEKIHGTLLQVGIVPRSIWEGKPWADKCPDIGDRGFKGIVTSKGQGAKGLMIDPSDIGNLYVKYAVEKGLWAKLEALSRHVQNNEGEPVEQPVFIFGEIYGVASTQDLTYGVQGNFRAFDIYIGTRSNGNFVDQAGFEGACKLTAIQTVPVLYQGPFSADIVRRHTDGNTVLTDERQIREGVVIKATDGSSHPRYGRRIAKSISEKYLMRKNATELQ